VFHGDSDKRHSGCFGGYGQALLCQILSKNWGGRKREGAEGDKGVSPKLWLGAAMLGGL